MGGADSRLPWIPRFSRLLRETEFSKRPAKSVGCNQAVIQIGFFPALGKIPSTLETDLECNDRSTS